MNFRIAKKIIKNKDSLSYSRFQIEKAEQILRKKARGKKDEL